MTEETIIEKSTLEMLIESFNVYVLLFIIVFVTTAVLLGFDKTDVNGALAILFGSAIITILFKKLLEEEKK